MLTLFSQSYKVTTFSCSTFYPEFPSGIIFFAGLSYWQQHGNALYVFLSGSHSTMIRIMSNFATASSIFNVVVLVVSKCHGQYCICVTPDALVTPSTEVGSLLNPAFGHIEFP